MTNFARCFQIIIVTRALWSDRGVRPETDTLTPKFVSPQMSRLGSHDKRPHWNTTLDLFEPWPVKKESSFFPPKQRTAESLQGRANRTLNPISQRKGWGRKKWKERKEKDENKEKNKRKKREDSRSKIERKWKGKRSNSRSMKERRQKFFKARLPLRIILDWQYPTPHEQRGKDRNTQLPLQKHYPWENPIGPWSYVWSMIQ